MATGPTAAAGAQTPSRGRQSEGAARVQTGDEQQSRLDLEIGDWVNAHTPTRRSPWAQHTRVKRQRQNPPLLHRGADAREAKRLWTSCQLFGRNLTRCSVYLLGAWLGWDCLSATSQTCGSAAKCDQKPMVAKRLAKFSTSAFSFNNLSGGLSRRTLLKSASLGPLSFCTATATSTASPMNSPTRPKSSSTRPREVIAGAPTLRPLGFIADLSPGIVFLLSTIDAISQTISDLFPFTPLDRKSTSRRWLSVPPDQVQVAALEALSHGLRVLHHLLLVELELRSLSHLERHGQRCDRLVVRAALEAREHSCIDLVLEVVHDRTAVLVHTLLTPAEEDHGASRPA